MSKTMLVIVANGGQYEDVWHRVVGVAHDRSEVDRFIAEKKATWKREHDLNRQFWEEYERFVPQTPEPHVPYEREEIPSWGSGRDQRSITPEMRAERQAIKDRNAARHLAAKEQERPLEEAREAELEAEEDRIWSKLGITDPEQRKHLHSLQYWDEPRYRVWETPVLGAVDA